MDNSFTKGQFGDQNQVALQCVTWWLFILHFCFKAEIHPDTLNEAIKTLCGKQSKYPKNVSAWTSVSSHFSNNWLKYCKTFKSHHPSEMNEPGTPQSSFYFTIKHKQNPGNILYKKSPLEKNEVGKPLLKAAQS